MRGRDQAFGRWGEDVACKYLTGLGWRVVDRNWRCDVGEIDVVGRQPDGTVVFVEVKTRRGVGFGLPVEAITDAKRSKLRALAWRWLDEHQPHAPAVRIDGVGVLAATGGTPTIQHVRGVDG